MATVPGNPGTYDWTIPVLTGAMSNSRVRVTLQDSRGALLAKDDSNTAFTMHP